MTKSDQIVLALVLSALGADCGVDSGLFRDAVCGVCRGYLGLRLEGIPEIERDEGAGA